MLVRGDEGLWVLPSTANFTQAQVTVGEQITRTATVTPLAEGSHRLSVSVQGEIDGLLQANNVTIRIEVGGATMSPEPTGTLRAVGEVEAINSSSFPKISMAEAVVARSKPGFRE